LRENECKKAEECEGVKNWSRVQRRAKKKENKDETDINKEGWLVCSEQARVGRAGM
jgi:hypothetical protein